MERRLSLTGMARSHELAIPATSFEVPHYVARIGTVDIRKLGPRLSRWRKTRIGIPEAAVCRSMRSRSKVRCTGECFWSPAVGWVPTVFLDILRFFFPLRGSHIRSTDESRTTDCCWCAAGFIWILRRPDGGQCLVNAL